MAESCSPSASRAPSRSSSASTRTSVSRSDSTTAGGHVGQVGIGCAPPEVECAVERVRGARGVAVGRLRTRGIHEAIESARVDRIRVEGDRVAAGAGRDRACTEGAAQAADRRLELLRPGTRRLVTPDRVGELIG